MPSPTKKKASHADKRMNMHISKCVYMHKHTGTISVFTSQRRSTLPTTLSETMSHNSLAERVCARVREIFSPIVYFLGKYKHRY